MNPLVEKGLAKYEEARIAGMNNEEAKAYAYSEVPELESNITRRDVMTHWGNGLKRIQKEYDDPDKQPAREANETSRTAIDTICVNGNPFASIATFSRYMFRRWCERVNVTINDEFVFSLNQWRDAYEAATGNDSTNVETFVTQFYPSQKDGILFKAGWRFDVIYSKDHLDRCSIIVRSMPAPPAPVSTEPVPSPQLPGLSDADIERLAAAILRMKQ